VKDASCEAVAEDRGADGWGTHGNHRTTVFGICTGWVSRKGLGRIGDGLGDAGPRSAVDLGVGTVKREGAVLVKSGSSTPTFAYYRARCASLNRRQLRFRLQRGFATN
jgi:hypothetical protein